jgi:hypothetical protein
MEQDLVKKLIEEVIRNPDKYPAEAKLVLVLKEWSRQGPAYVDDQNFEVIHGDVEEITLRYFDEGYPYRRGREVALIPKVVPTIVKVEYRTNTTDPPIHSVTLYIFTGDGWKRVDVH